MNRLFPFAFGSLQLGLAAVCTYVLCSGEMLNQMSVLFAR